MFSTILRRATYANVAATLALFLSISGGALAASHYLITSKKQISPSVLKALRGKKGARVPAGPAGPAGAAGAAGAPGSARAYAQVLVNGAGNPSFSESSGFTSVTEPQPGVFCLNPIIPGHPVLVSPASTEATFFTVSPQQCAGGYEIATNTSIPAGAGFQALVP